MSGPSCFPAHTRMRFGGRAERTARAGRDASAIARANRSVADDAYRVDRDVSHTRR